MTTTTKTTCESCNHSDELPLLRFGGTFTKTDDNDSSSFMEPFALTFDDFKTCSLTEPREKYGAAPASFIQPLVFEDSSHADLLECLHRLVGENNGVTSTTTARTITTSPPSPNHVSALLLDNAPLATSASMKTPSPPFMMEHRIYHPHNMESETTLVSLHHNNTKGILQPNIKPPPPAKASVGQQIKPIGASRYRNQAHTSQVVAPPASDGTSTLATTEQPNNGASFPVAPSQLTAFESNTTTSMYDAWAYQLRQGAASAKDNLTSVEQVLHQYQADLEESSQQISPFDFMKLLLAERGLPLATFSSTTTHVGYQTDPSPLQIASYGTKLIDAVHTGNVKLIHLLLGCGLSPNPCNSFGDCLLSWVCRKSQDVVFSTFLEHGADLRVCDSFGRTPLHHAAWSSSFSPLIVASILLRDPMQLFLQDKTGRTPLEYVPPKQTVQWLAFLEEYKEELFPIRSGPTPSLTVATTRRVNGGQLPDPPHAIPVDLARLVSSGRVPTEQLCSLQQLTQTTCKLLSSCE